MRPLKKTLGAGAAKMRRPLFLLIFLASCASAGRMPDGAVLIEGVPFYPERSNHCGPASLAGVLNYRGVNVTPEEIASEIYSKTAKGTLNIDIGLYAKRKGLDSLQYGGNIEDLRRNIDRGNPLIVMVDYGFWVYRQGHFMVVTGYSDKGIIVNSGMEREKFIPTEEFLKSWERTGFWSLLVTREK